MTTGPTYTAWEPFARTTSWTFASGDGTKTLWVKVKNGVGLDSAAATTSIAVDTVPPSATTVEPAPGAAVVGLRPVFRVVFDESIDPSTWTDLGLIIQSASGELVAGDYSYDATTRTGAFVPRAELTPGTTYVVTIGDVTDTAGNGVSPRGSWTVLPLAPVDLEVSPTSRVLATGGSTSVDVSLIGAPAPVVVQVLAATSPSPDFLPLTTLALVNGHGSLVVTPASNTTYRFAYAGGNAVAPAGSDLRVLVRRSVALSAPASPAVARAKVGATVRLTAAVGPAAAGVSVSFRLYRYDVARRHWVYAGSLGRRTDASGHASLAWHATQPGSYYWRASVGSTSEFANNISPVYRWTVSR